MQDWCHIGRVTVKIYGGSSLNFNTLEEAVRWVGKTHIEGLKYGRLAFGIWSYPVWGDSHIFLDELGLVIPVWRVQEAYRNLPNRYIPYRHRRWKTRHSCHQHRYPRTQQERRELQEDGRRRLPTSWDDLNIAARENRNWKQFRKTQWRSK